MKRLLFSSIIILTFVTACITRTPPESIAEKPLLYVADIDESGLFSSNHGGTKVALSSNGLILLDPVAGDKKRLSSAVPTALAWSPDGLSLAAAFERADYETELLVYSADGEVLNEVVLPVSLNQLHWSSRGDLLAVGFVLKIYSFGGNLRQLLYRVEGDTSVETTLSDTTLRPALAKQVKPLLHRLLPISFSPHGDELVYLRLHDPPEFSAYFQLLYQNWQSPEPRALYKTSLQAISFEWAPSGDMLRVFHEEGVQKLELWPSEEDIPALNTKSPYRFVDGRLYHGQELLVDWGKESKMQRLFDGRFLLAVNRSLYLGDGLEGFTGQVYSEAKWNLRRWRYEELVTPDEYQELLKEMN